MKQHPDIRGVFFRPLSWIPDDRGNVAELWRESWEAPTLSEPDEAVPTRIESGEVFKGWTGREHDVGTVRQIYVSETRPGVVKAWHFHKQQTDRFVCLRGVVRLVLFDAREGSETFENFVEILLDADRALRLVIIPPGVVHGWKCLGTGVALCLNGVSREWCPPGAGHDEYRRSAGSGPVDGVDYNWRASVNG